MSNFYQKGGRYYGQQQQQSSFTQPRQQAIWQGPAADYSQQQQQQPQYSNLQQQSSNQNSDYNNNQQPNNDGTMHQFWNPAASSAMTSAAMAAATMANSGMSSAAMIDMASGMGKNFIQSNAARMIPGLETSMITLRSYFHVDNNYVLRKMTKCLFPFLSKNWRRVEKDAPPAANSMSVMPHYELPTLDENAPDLYLPLMALITYVLLCALCYGNAGQFNPEVLPDVTSRCILTQVMEVVLIRFGFYAMQAPTQILDLFCFTGYKYVGLSVSMLVGLLSSHFGVGAKAYYVALLWTASAAAYVMLKIMANNIPVHTSTAGPKREVMVLSFAVSQLVTMWFVSQTKFL